MTTRVKGYPFEVKRAGEPVRVALADQVKSLDWLRHNATRRGRASAARLAEVKAKLPALIG